MAQSVTPQPEVEIYPREKPDRRLAPNIPGRGGSRRGNDQRFEAELQVSVFDASEETAILRCFSEDLSASGMLLHWPDDAQVPAVGDKYVLRFSMPPGVLPEGYESRVRLPAEVVRLARDEDGALKVGVNFQRSIDRHLRLKKWLRLIATAVLLIGLSVLAVVYMRQESVFYFMRNGFC